MSKKLKLYFQLLEVLTIRELKSRYRASILGPLWIIIQPLLTTLFLAIVFEKIVKIKINNIPYFLFLYSGIMIWNFFEQSINLAKESLVWNRDLITKSKFNKEVLPISYVLSKIVDYLVNFLVFLILLIIYHFKIKLLFFITIFNLFPLFLTVTSVSLIFSALNAIFRDFGRIIEFILLLGFYATPIIYSENMIPEKIKIFIQINPLSYIINFNRQVFFENKVDYYNLFLPAIFGVIFFIISWLIFKKLEKKIVDLI